MHVRLILCSVLCKIFNLTKFELQCSIQVKIYVKMYITKNRFNGLKVVFALEKYSNYAFVTYVWNACIINVKKQILNVFFK